jgi:hypothetical protein
MEPEVHITRSILLRALYAVLGFAFLGLGIAGTLIPGIPGTINLIVALWFFSMSSERMHCWMLENRLFGKQLRDYKAGLGIPRRVKIFAVTSITLAVGISTMFFIENLWLRIGLILFGIVGIWFVLTRPTTEVEVARRAAAAAAS